MVLFKVSFQKYQSLKYVTNTKYYVITLIPRGAVTFFFSLLWLTSNSRRIFLLISSSICCAKLYFPTTRQGRNSFYFSVLEKWSAKLSAPENSALGNSLVEISLNERRDINFFLETI